MSGIFSGALAAGLLATAAMIASDIQHIGAAASEPGYEGQAFRLQVEGAASCVLEKDAKGVESGAAVDLHGCEALSPDFGAIRFWREGGDGTVVLTREDGGLVAEFAVADGVAYQTFRPGAPLASLIALN